MRVSRGGDICRVFLGGEDISAFCREADDQEGWAIVIETWPDAPPTPEWEHRKLAGEKHDRAVRNWLKLAEGHYARIVWKDGVGTLQMKMVYGFVQIKDHIARMPRADED